MRRLNESFHAQHSPLGAFASFTIGLSGGTGGFGHALSGPAKQNVYVGFRRGERGNWRMLPFFEQPKSQEGAFTGEAATDVIPDNVIIMKGSEFQRSLGWASDTWRAGKGKFGFSLLSPFGEVPDPARLNRKEKRIHFSPHINGWIEYDNRSGKSAVELMFGVGDSEHLFRPLQDTCPALKGFAVNGTSGYATELSDRVEVRQGFDIMSPKFRDYRGLHVIAGQSALVFSVPAGKKARFPLVLGFYEEGTITDGISTQYAYTRIFKDLEDVLEHGLSQKKHYLRLAEKRDRELERANLNVDQKFLLAQSTHSYLGNTQLLWEGKSPLWVVNEGEYRMINTFDLTVDHLFFELKFFPWAVRNVLDLFVRRYSYRDRIHDGNGAEFAGGLSFTHDMGVMNHFTPKGRSSYECDNIGGCFSHMTMEQLLNWVIVAVSYADKVGDWKWLKANEKVLLACARSLRNRDDPKPSMRNGIMKFDSMRCGEEGSEITTYDSLDASLGQARNNLYLAVKTLSAWVLLEKAFSDLKRDRDAISAGKTADLLAATISSKFNEKTRTFPAVFENNNRSRIIPAIEGFVYPLYLDMDWVTNRKGRFSQLLDQLGLHLAEILEPGVCLDEKSGGWKMSSTSTNTWFSKIALCQHVVRRLFPETLTSRARAADQVHADWQRMPGCGEFAMCDQIRSDTGITCGSRYYPRGVTSILWLDE